MPALTGPELEQRYRELFDGAPLGIYVSRPDGTLLACNAAFARMLGFASVDAAVGASMHAIYEPDRHHEQFVAFVRAEGRIEQDRSLLRRRDGSLVHVIETAIGEFDAEGELVEIRGFLLDVTAIVAAEQRLVERLIQAEKIESVGRLAGGIAHDFNNLLTAILGYTELLLGDRSEHDSDRRDLEEIRKAGQRAASLTQQLLAYSRKQVLLPKDVDLNQAVAGLQELLSRVIREDIAIACEFAPAPAVIRVDPGQLQQAIVNLVLNARDALPAGGQIRLEIDCLFRSHADMPPEQTSPSGEYVRLRVVDNGVGITPDARPHLFEPFFTTKAVGQGSGMGLASVYGIVRQSNGFITVDSEPGAGSAFAMHFPAVLPVDAGTSDHTILLVEDEPAVRAIVSDMLTRQGYEVLEAPTPQAAIELFGKRSADVDLLVTDVVMPEMSGPALAQRLIGLRPDLQVLFISGYADMSRQPDAGADGNENVSFLSKPFQATSLTARVGQLLARLERAPGGSLAHSRTPRRGKRAEKLQENSRF
jgi:two-component system cell cycle sensor histidine kinase/response regulator CckA